jgi:DNA repair photolyase
MSEANQLDGRRGDSRSTMNRKPVYEVPAKTIINFESGFVHKLMCDGPVFSLGTACVYSCAFCYVPDMYRKMKPYLEKQGITGRHQDMVIRRKGALDCLRHELTHPDGSPKFNDPRDRRVIYSSPSVDVAGNMELVRETIEACAIILSLTHWQIRLLSKSNLLPKVAQGLIDGCDGFVREDMCKQAVGRTVRKRVIFGVSTGTLDDKLALSFEQGTPLPSKRLQSLYWLQDNGFRTFGMICPSLPQWLPGESTVAAYMKFARDMAEAIRARRCEHVWAEVINVRGESMRRTEKALREGGYGAMADELHRVSVDKHEWEDYARQTFLAHAEVYHRHPGKLRFLQYVTAESRQWWTARKNIGSIVL